MVIFRSRFTRHGRTACPAVEGYELPFGFGWRADGVAGRQWQDVGEEFCAAPAKKQLVVPSDELYRRCGRSPADRLFGHVTEEVAGEFVGCHPEWVGDVLGGAGGRGVETAWRDEGQLETLQMEVAVGFAQPRSTGDGEGRGFAFQPGGKFRALLRWQKVSKRRGEETPCTPAGEEVGGWRGKMVDRQGGQHLPIVMEGFLGSGDVAFCQELSCFVQFCQDAIFTVAFQLQLQCCGVFLHLSELSEEFLAVAFVGELFRALCGFAELSCRRVMESGCGEGCEKQCQQCQALPCIAEDSFSELFVDE